MFSKFKKLSSKGGKITYHITNPFKYGFFFNGNKGFKSVRLLDSINFLDFDAVGIIVYRRISLGIESFYKKRGYALAKVKSYEERTEDPFFKRMIVDVNEGPKVQIKEIKIKGFYTKPSSYYRKLLKEYSDPIVRKGYYYKKGVQKGIQDLNLFLKNKAYLRSKVLLEGENYGEKKQFVSLVIYLYEGERVRVERIRLKGVSKNLRPQILKVLGFKDGDYLSLDMLENNLRKIEIFYKDRGFLDFKLKNKGASNLVKYIDEKAFLNLDVSEGDKIIVSKIEIKGNEFTQSYVIYQELDFKVGDVLTLSDLLSSQRSLNNLNIFGDVRISWKGKGGSKACENQGV